MVTHDELRLRLRIGDNVRRVRKASNLSVKDVAERAGMGVRTLQRVEAGQANLSIGLGVDVTELLEPSPPLPS